MPIKHQKNIAQILSEFKQFKKQLPIAIGGIGVRFFKDNFRRQGFLDKSLEPWKKRKDGTTDGILSKSGNLRRSIRTTKVTEDNVTVGTYKKYAQIHNEGGTITQTPTPKQRKFFWAKYYASEKTNEAWKGAALAKQIHITIPQRKFIGNSQTLDNEIDDHILNELNNIL
ncbi:MAG: phage virion morphogenesis protein [Sphingobacteriales bacterium]|jgi:phage gpG-like protein|nr:phage virion morphogenesis protein [Sphingobacteriales bacterium]